VITRLLDFLKSSGITTLLTNLSSEGRPLESTSLNISSLVDTWLLLRDIETGGERNRALYILKSRGMAHSNQIREFLLTNHGIDLQDVYLGPDGVLTGSARQSQEARERAAAINGQQEIEARKRERARKREALEASIAAMRQTFEADEEEAQLLFSNEKARRDTLLNDRERMAVKRKADVPKAEPLPAPGGRKPK
jgi:circadian clock protein KaiC